MKFEVILSDEAKSDIEKLKKSGNKKALKKLYDLLKELESNPKTGTGRPEQLKHYEIPTWSRRISGEHRLVYRV
ncbi:MAG: Txe/YoeB family addiction module toxin [Flavobacteriaceae bacterium]